MERNDIVIVGGGLVGQTLSARLTEAGRDVTLVESDPHQARELSGLLDVRVIEGNGALPQTLRDAGIERIPVRTMPTFNTMGDPEMVLPLANARGWDISSDGNTIVVVTRTIEIEEIDILEPKIIWYQNWSDYLKREFD